VLAKRFVNFISLQTDTPSQVGANSTTGVPRLRRVLTLWDLIFYGIVLIMPIAPILLLGIGQKLSHGHFVTTILVSMVAMMFTAVSYGRMAALYRGRISLHLRRARAESSPGLPGRLGHVP